MSKKIIIDVDGAVKAHNQKNPDKKINRSQLAKKLNLSYQSVMNYNNGTVPVILGTLLKISKITGVSLDDLIKEVKE